jgi:hypothetical protein
VQGAHVELRVSAAARRGQGEEEAVVAKIAADGKEDVEDISAGLKLEILGGKS